jgi:hypothetical protein
MYGQILFIVSGSVVMRAFYIKINVKKYSSFFDSYDRGNKPSGSVRTVNVLISWATGKFSRTFLREVGSKHSPYQVFPCVAN